MSGEMQWYNGMSDRRRHIKIGGMIVFQKHRVGKLFLKCDSYQTSRDFNVVMGATQFFMKLISMNFIQVVSERIYGFLFPQKTMCCVSHPCVGRLC